MELTSATNKVQERLEQIQAALLAAKGRILELEAQERRLQIALEVMQSLGDDSALFPSSGRVTKLSDLLELGSTSPDDSYASATRKLASLAGLLRKNTRQLVIEQFVMGEALTRLHVIERIKATGEQVNDQTVASTLSKLTAEGILERVEGPSGSGYQLKVAAPSAEDTESGDDLA